MKTENEIREALKACNKVSSWGLSKGPCPFETPSDWMYEDEDDDGNITIDKNKDISKYLRGCCAECSFPSTLNWVLNDDNNPSDNGQELLIDAMLNT